jgi:hypothetical protein
MTRSATSVFHPSSLLKRLSRLTASLNGGDISNTLSLRSSRLLKKWPEKSLVFRLFA